MGGRRPMKILMLHPHDLHYFPWTIRIIRLGQELVRAGHRVTIGYVEFAYKDKAYYEKVIRPELPPEMNYLEFKPRARHFFSILKQLKQVCPGVDLVHVQKCFSQVTLPGLFLAYRMDCPIHYDWDDNESGLGHEWIKFRPALWEIKLYERILPRLVDSMSFASEALRQKALRLGVPDEDLFPAPVGADLEAFRPERDGRAVRDRYDLGEGPVVMYMGQLGGAAYANLLLDAIPLVLREEPGTRFFVVGGGRRLEALMEQAKDLGIGDKVTFSGYVEQERVPDYVAAADVAVATFEDNEITRCKSPLKIAEYLAAGKPIVATDVGDVPRMIEGGGQLVRPGSVEDFAGAIVRYVRDPELRKRHGEVGRRRAEQTYNWQATGRSLLRAYERAFEKRGRTMPK